MTDKEIIKALECISSKENVLCKNCSYNKYHLMECHRTASKDAIDLINRQQAENRKLQLENEKLEIELKGKIESSNKSRDSAMEVIKKQDAEIERLQELATEKQNLTEQWQDEVKQLIMRNEVAKSEAIKEFAERLDRKFAFYYSDTQCISAKTIRESIRNELKETVGDAE